MQFWAGIFAGIAASALFWLVDKYLFTFPHGYQVGGMIACFVIFGSAGYWMASRAPKKPERQHGTRVASGLKGRNVKVRVDGVTTTGDADIIADVDAKADIDADAKNIKTKS